jgi:SAM-dependent methyltransferase
MSAEFDTVAEWTADAAVELGPDFYTPAACRGSGSPAALDWLIDGLDLAAGQSLLDSGAGVGGPAAYAAQQRSVRPVLVEPEAGACRAARSLFDHPVIQASGTQLPLRDESFDAAWCLGVLCTVPEQLKLLSELRRVVRPGGRVGLLVFVLRLIGAEQPEGNHFPTAASLTLLADRAGLRIEQWQGVSDLPPVPSDWQRREEAVAQYLQDRHGREETWRMAEHQSDVMGRLLSESAVTGEMLTLRRL